MDTIQTPSTTATNSNPTTTINHLVGGQSCRFSASGPIVTDKVGRRRTRSGQAQDVDCRIRDNNTNSIGSLSYCAKVLWHKLNHRHTYDTTTTTTTHSKINYSCERSCLIRRDSKCHPTRSKPNSHLTAINLFRLDNRKSTPSSLISRSLLIANNLFILFGILLFVVSITSILLLIVTLRHKSVY